MEEKLKLYLDYLDKEMSIMGILSTFCLAVPAIIFERVTTANDNFLAYVWICGESYFLIASVSMLAAASLFYKERSELAWYYGQIALKENLPDYVEPSINQWLKDVDSWETWVWYKIAFYLIFFASFEYVIAFGSYYCPSIQENEVSYIIFPFFFLLISLVLMILVNLKFKYKERPFISWIKREKD
jgi:hypothetical protein